MDRKMKRRVAFLVAHGMSETDAENQARTELLAVDVVVRHDDGTIEAPNDGPSIFDAEDAEDQKRL